MHLHNLIIKTSLVYNVSEFESSSDFKQGGLIFFIIINLKIKWKPVFYLKKKETKRRKRHQNNVHRWRFKPRDPYHALFHLMLRAHEPWPKCFSDTLYNLLLALGPLSLDHVFTIMYSGVKWKGCKSDLRSNWVLQIWLLQPWPLSALASCLSIWTSNLEAPSCQTFQHQTNQLQVAQKPVDLHICYGNHLHNWH